jgi:hypothetical protein
MAQSYTEDSETIVTYKPNTSQMNEKDDSDILNKMNNYTKSPAPVYTNETQTNNNDTYVN